MALDLFPTTQDYPFPMPAQGYWGRSVNVTRNVILVLLVLLVLVIVALPSFAEDIMPMPSTAVAGTSQPATSEAPKLNPSMPGMRTGVLTKVTGKMVQIDGTTYLLSSQALLADDAGGLIIQLGDGLTHQHVRYWIGINDGRSQIIQMIVTLLG
jgi:hypothetical protein